MSPHRLGLRVLGSFFLGFAIALLACGEESQPPPSVEAVAIPDDYMTRHAEGLVRMVVDPRVPAGNRMRHLSAGRLSEIGEAALAPIEQGLASLPSDDEELGNRSPEEREALREAREVLEQALLSLRSG